ncbi:hypothetical protein ATO12_19365 [Aquimarina atlantica]|uniref:Uncharacterized protein n=1 Tax=Aquimarina atlantica TaxID=1317122 RepID=A0A023BT31_9FLAO|nr:hypothetical protein [Aquimarina atlantica]EZH73167.1 hypothetical protein ATO12_19365 [Aquimarina atlantica]
MKKILEKYSEKPKNLFGLLFMNFLFGYAPLALLLGILSLLDIVPVNFNGEATYGIKGFIIMILFIPFVAFLFAFFMWVYFLIGNFFMKLFKNIF